MILLRKERASAIVDWAEFGKWIAREQARTGYSDRELARLSGMSATHIGMVKKGQTALGDERFESLVQALGLTIADAKRAIQLQRPELSPEEREVLDLMHRAPQHDKRRIVSIVRAYVS